MDRRTLLRALGGVSVGVSLAGCATQDNGTDDTDGLEDDGLEDETDDATNVSDPDGDELEGTLWVATYSSMLEDENPAGVWIEEAFEEAYPGIELEWTVPDGDVGHYIQRAQQGVEVETDVYLGLNVDDLVRIDDTLDEQLFVSLERDRIERIDRVREDPSVEFDDPHGRVVPYDTGYISLVYDETEVPEPTSFDDLTEPEFEDALLIQNAQYSDPGQAFLLWTIAEFGEDGYLEYWEALLENGVSDRDDWWSSYLAYLEEERPMVVSYSTDQVYAVADGHDLSRHQVGFLDGQGYANPEGVGIFTDSEKGDLAYAFIDFLLSRDAQAEIATRNVQFPAVADEYVDLDESFTDYAFEPDEPVALGYDDLSGNLDEWVDDWARLLATQ
ncbi:thiamine ABC transporter substrate-binding protein [Natronobiforma cellulositropha]|uniref:thiamine ABC transporter substrate-binding protein n=1 Tax=Natronobiforma cellulositropha TaxID=1679076 RepID=UPI0021D573E1|nr:thiamine ABC transporter substrate-binding protein [Natronobiforma cellulositropha]